MFTISWMVCLWIATVLNTQLWKMKLLEKKLTLQKPLNFSLCWHSHTVKHCLADQFQEKQVNNPRDNSGEGKQHNANSAQKHGFSLTNSG